jgi:hypothetical protein
MSDGMTGMAKGYFPVRRSGMRLKLCRAFFWSACERLSVAQVKAKQA